MPVQKFYLTCAIDYVNGLPHIGHAFEKIQGDCVTRYYRLQGRDVRFLVGTDEHGMKLYQTAKEQGMEAEALVKKNAPYYRKMAEALNLANDDFIQTTEKRHIDGCVEMWKKLVAAGDIYKASYEGLYCVGCEAFVFEKDLIDGLCPHHKKAPQKLSEENYFFRLSKYSDAIYQKIDSDELKIVPEERKREFLNVVKEGLHDISFSRPKSVLPWGVPVPDDSGHTMYVWPDALLNYATAVGFGTPATWKKLGKYWPADVHLIGKDILRFHAGIWIGQLLSAQLPLPKSIYVHGFITVEGQKMSKTIGNVLDPFALVEKYGVDSLRYYFLREVPTTGDGDFSNHRMDELYSADLANTFGNLVSRVLAMTQKYTDGFVPDVLPRDIWNFVEHEQAYHAGFASFDLRQSVLAVFSVLHRANQYVDEKKPWVLAKNDTKELLRVLRDLLEVLRWASFLLEPFIPSTAQKTQALLNISSKKKTFSKKHEVQKPAILFPKRD